jgi:hypothetical protein
VHFVVEGDLSKVADAGDVMSFGFGAGERREEKTGKDGDDGNDDQQLDQGKSGTGSGRNKSHALRRMPVG